MRWVPEPGELSCSVHYHTSDCPALSLLIYFSAAVGAAVVLETPSEWLWLSGLRLWAVDVTAIFQSMVLLLLGQLMKVCLTEGLGSSSSLGTSQSLVSVLDFLARVGGG